MLQRHADDTTRLSRGLDVGAPYHEAREVVGHQADIDGVADRRYRMDAVAEIRELRGLDDERTIERTWGASRAGSPSVDGTTATTPPFWRRRVSRAFSDREAGHGGEFPNREPLSGEVVSDPLLYELARSLDWAPPMTRPILLILALLPAIGCGTGAPDPKPICTHLDEIVRANEAEWVGMDKCIEVLSLVPEGGKDEWAKELKCLGEAKDHPAARTCASWLNTSLYLEHPNADLAGVK